MIVQILRGALAACVAFLLWLGAAQAQIQIAAIGDSSFEGKFLAPAETFPGQLERALKAEGHDVVVTNSGRWGDTTTQILSRLDSAAPPGTQIALVIGGDNDLHLGKSPSDIRDNLYRIVERLRARNIEVLLFYSAELPRPEGWNMDRLTFLPRFLQSVPNDPKFYIEGIGGHLNSRGYAIVVHNVLPAVEQAIAYVMVGG